MAINKIVFLAIFLNLFFARPVLAAERFVFSGQKIADVIQLAAAGDTIRVHDGVYRERVVINKPLTITAVAGETPVIDGQGVALGENYGLVEINSGVNNVIFSGFEVKNSSQRGIVNKGSNNLISHNKVHNIFLAALHNSGATNSKFLGNEVYCAVLSNASSECFANGKPVCNVNIDGGWPSALNVYGATDNITWQENIVHDNCGEGMVVGNNDKVIKNTVYDNWSVNIYLDSDYSNIVTGNYVYETETEYIPRDGGNSYRQIATGIGFQQESSCKNTTPNTLVANNIVTGARYGLSFYPYSYCATTGLRNVKVLNNSFLDSWDYGLRIIDGMHENTLIANNIFYSQKGQEQIVEQPDGISLQNNLWNDPVIDKNFQLTFGSLAIDAGMNVSIYGVDRDYFGTIRPQGRAYDIGAHEFQNIPEQPSFVNTTNILNLRSLLSQFTTIFAYNELVRGYGK